MTAPQFERLSRCLADAAALSRAIQRHADKHGGFQFSASEGIFLCRICPPGTKRPLNDPRYCVVSDEYEALVFPA
jgi:hypothetical protein